ncbi:hypothetical protein Bbelb_114620 [Branchiostoma belcheri]|nr:hypothetical protein Bbelb_114620 [Branchiostoma belcheri]
MSGRQRQHVVPGGEPPSVRMKDLNDGAKCFFISLKKPPAPPAANGRLTIPIARNPPPGQRSKTRCAVKYSEQLCENMKKCEDWRKTSDELLYQMIPRTVADRLRRGMDVNDTVEAFPEVTVMFSYLVGFMEISAKVPAVQLVTTINDFFTLFDTISLRHDVFKFETLGDAVYMVVGGAPERNPRHAHCVAALALELNREVERLKNPIDGAKLKVKIGMHSGPVVAGVISLKMPQYCMVGDTVNTASRMGTNSEPGKITLSESVNKLLYGGEFITAYRGTLLVKGKGRMKTYWLVGARVARPCSPPSLLKPRSWKDLQRGMSIEFDCMHEVEKEMLQNSPLQDIAESQESLTEPRAFGARWSLKQWEEHPHLKSWLRT